MVNKLLKAIAILYILSAIACSNNPKEVVERTKREYVDSLSYILDSLFLKYHVIHLKKLSDIKHNNPAYDIDTANIIFGYSMLKSDSLAIDLIAKGSSKLSDHSDELIINGIKFKEANNLYDSEMPAKMEINIDWNISIFYKIGVCKDSYLLITSPIHGAPGKSINLLMYYIIKYPIKKHSEIYYYESYRGDENRLIDWNCDSDLDIVISSELITQNHDSTSAYEINIVEVKSGKKLYADTIEYSNF